MGSRFKGWTESDLIPLGISEREQKANVLPKQPVQPTVDNPAIIHQALQICGIKSVREFKFLKERDFRFDVAIPEFKIAIEYEGGIFSHGRHVRGKGYAKDCVKYNLAVINGWKVLRYTPVNTQKLNWEFQVVGDVQKLIKPTEK